MDLKEQHLLGDAVNSHWYYRAKLAALKKLVAGLPAGEVLDVGAGSGFFARALLTDTAMTGAVCVDPNYAQDSDEIVAGKPLRFRRSVAASDASLVLMMDVIEHVPDDRQLVADYVDLVPRGTRFVVSVPAFAWLWSDHDVYLEHYRRYTLRQLETVLAAAGLTIEQGHYFYGAVLPLVWAARQLQRAKPKDAAPKTDLRPHSRLVNTVLHAVSRAEVGVMRANRLAGTTVFALAIKA